MDSWRVAGVRVKPSYLNVHEYRQMAEEKRNDERDAAHSPDKPPPSRPRRATAAYKDIRKNHRDVGKQRARDLRNLERAAMADRRAGEEGNTATYLRSSHERDSKEKKMRPPTDVVCPTAVGTFGLDMRDPLST